MCGRSGAPPNRSYAWMLRRQLPGGGPAERTKAAVLEDVAGLAGVSAMTVSRVLNAPEKVRPETRARVLAAVQELGYRPNFAARSLVTGRLGRPRRGQFRHHSVRPRLHPLRHRTRRQGTRLPGQHRQSRHDDPEVDRRGRRPAAPAVGRRGDRDRPPRVGRRGPARPAARPARGRRGRRRAPRPPPRSRSTTTGGRSGPPGTCSTWATRPSTTSAARSTGSTATTASRAGATPCATARPRRRSSATGPPTAATNRANDCAATRR